MSSGSARRHEILRAFPTLALLKSIVDRLELYVAHFDVREADFAYLSCLYVFQAASIFGVIIRFGMSIGAPLGSCRPRAVGCLHVRIVPSWYVLIVLLARERTQLCLVLTRRLQES